MYKNFVPISCKDHGSADHETGIKIEGSKERSFR